MKDRIIINNIPIIPNIPNNINIVSIGKTIIIILLK